MHRNLYKYYSTVCSTFNAYNAMQDGRQQKQLQWQNFLSWHADTPACSRQIITADGYAYIADTDGASGHSLPWNQQAHDMNDIMNIHSLLRAACLACLSAINTCHFVAPSKLKASK